MEMPQLPWSSAVFGGAYFCATGMPLYASSPSQDVDGIMSLKWTTIRVWGSIDVITSKTGWPSMIDAVIFGSMLSLCLAPSSVACGPLHVFECAVAKQFSTWHSVPTKKRTQLHCLIFRLLSSSWIMSKEPNLYRTCEMNTFHKLIRRDWQFKSKLRYYFY